MSEDNNFKDNMNSTYDEAKKSASEFSEGARETFQSQENKKILAGVLAILLGYFGVHKFILGYNKEGIILLVISLISCGIVGSVIGLIEGIVYLTKSDAEFYQTYQVGKRPWF